MKNTVAIVGIGRVGSTIAYTLIIKNLVSQLLLVDANTDRCEGEVRDIADALAFSQTAHIKNASLEEAKSADIIIISAGFAQKDPSETRLDLAKKNSVIIADIMQKLDPLPSSTLILMVTNPVDAMTHVAQQYSSLPKNNIFGSGTWLDTQRLRRFLGQELTIAPESIDACVIGEHGDSQIVAWSQAHVGGIPIMETGINKETFETIARKTEHEVYDIIEKKCATYFGIAACIADICEAIIFDQKRIIPVSAFRPALNVCLSVPSVIGKNGVEREMICALSATDREQLHKSAAALETLIKSLPTSQPSYRQKAK